VQEVEREVTRHASAVAGERRCHVLEARATVGPEVMHSPCEGLEFGFRMISRTRVLSDHELVIVYRAAEIMG
jgi:hypothetical protein